MNIITVIFCWLFAFLPGSLILAEDIKTQPTVARQVLICDMWQWIGGSATTWGCLRTPRQVELAGGQVTDQVILSLQDQINKLEDRIEKLEHP